MNVTPIPLRDIDGTGLILGSQEKPLPGAKIVSNFLILLFVGAIVYYIFNLNFYRTIDCTVVSAEASSSGGGLRVAGSQQRIYVETEQCGTVTFVKMQNEGFRTAQDLADELNRHQGETLRFHISYFQFKNHEARAVELEGFPIRD